MEQEIIIDLSMTQEANDNLEMKHLLQQEAYEQLSTAIKDTTKKIEPFKKRLNDVDTVLRVRTHDVIMLDGARGSGKTTFIINAQKLLRKKELEDVLFLNIIDPTLIETREHVFINIIASIVKKVDIKRDKTTDTQFEDSYEKWRNILNNLALGLSLLDGVGESKLSKGDWADEYYVLEEGIKKAQSGSSLETSFHKFVDESLSLLGAKAFLLVFDDIDTDFAKGWPVLELLRKYLTTPQIVTVLCGDLNLYTTLVAKQQWKNLGYRLNTSADASPNHKTIVDEVIKQYLFKILRAPRRVTLRSIDHIRNARAISVCKQSDTQKNPIAPQELTPLLEKILGTLVGKQSKDDLSNTVTYITQKTPRELVNFLTTISGTTSDSWEMISEEHVSGGVQALTDLCFYALSNINYDKNNIYEKREKLASMHVLQGMVRAGIIESGAELAPRFLNVEKNDCAMVFASHLKALACNRIATYFEYWLRINLPSMAYIDLSSLFFLQYGNSKTKVIEGCIAHQGCLEGEPLPLLCRKYISFIWRNNPTPGGRGRINTFGLRNGTLHTVPGRRTAKPFKESLFPANIKRPELDIPDIGRAKSTVFWGKWLNTPATLRDGTDASHTFLAMLPFSINRDGDSSYVHFSIYNVLGALGGMLQTTNLEAFLSSIGQLREYPVARAAQAVWNGRQPSKPNEGDDLDDDDNENAESAEGSTREQSSNTGTQLNCFNAMFNKWIMAAPHQNRNLPSMQVAAKAWTRFHYALKRVPEAIKTEDCLAGSIMHRWVVLFLNSILVEELLAAGKKPKENNPVSSDANFLSNLERLQDTENDDPAPLASWLIACPLWHHYTLQRLPVHAELLKLSCTTLECRHDELAQLLPVDFRGTSLDNVCSLHNTVACTGHDTLYRPKNLLKAIGDMAAERMVSPNEGTQSSAPPDANEASKAPTLDESEADQASDSNDSKAD